MLMKMNLRSDLAVTGPLPNEGRERRSPPARPPLLRLLVLDSHQLFRESVASALREEAGFNRVEGAASDEAALTRLACGAPVDVPLLGGGSGERDQELVRAALEVCPGIKILVLGLEEGQHAAVTLLRAGASGYLFRDQSLIDLRAAILAVAAGEIVCTPRIANLLFTRLAELGRERRRDEQLDFLEL